MFKKSVSALALAFALAACGSSGEPTGQVVATVDGQEITTADLNTELGGASAPTPEGQKQLQRMALDNIVNRKIMANAAREQGLDKGPAAAILEAKAKDLALIELLNQQMRKKVPQPSDEEVRNFVQSNPDQFANHKLFVVDQIIVRSVTPQLAKALEPVKSLAEAQQILAAAKVPSNSTTGVIDTLTIPPAAAKQIAALPPGEVFIIPSNDGVRINVIRSTQTSPIPEAQARQIATEMLSRQRMQGQMNNELGKLVTEGRKSVKYNAAFAPPAAPSGAPKPAPAK